MYYVYVYVLFQIVPLALYQNQPNIQCLLTEPAIQCTKATKKDSWWMGRRPDQMGKFLWSKNPFPLIVNAAFETMVDVGNFHRIGTMQLGCLMLGWWD